MVVMHIGRHTFVTLYTTTFISARFFFEYFHSVSHVGSLYISKMSNIGLNLRYVSHVVHVTCRTAFSVKPDVGDSVCFVDDLTLAFAVGNNGVMYYTEQKMPKFIPG